MTRELANALLAMTWGQMDDLASRIAEIATDDNGSPNDVRYIASALFDDAQEHQQ